MVLPSQGTGPQPKDSGAMDTMSCASTMTAHHMFFSGDIGGASWHADACEIEVATTTPRMRPRLASSKKRNHQQSSSTLTGLYQSCACTVRPPMQVSERRARFMWPYCTWCRAVPSIGPRQHSCLRGPHRLTAARLPCLHSVICFGVAQFPC